MSALERNMESVRWLEPYFRPHVIRTSLLVTIGDRVNAITPGIYGQTTLRFSGEIVSWTLLADAVGSIVVDVWKTDYASYPPTVANTICGSNLPTLASAIKAKNLVELHDPSLTTPWTITFVDGDTFMFNVVSAATVKQVELVLHITKTVQT